MSESIEGQRLGDRLAMGPFVPFPPGRGNVSVPLASRRDAMAGLSLHAACRPSILFAQQAAWALVAVFGPRLVARRGTVWRPPMGLDGWHELCQAWRRDVGDFTVAAIYERPQASRSGVSVLLLSGGVPIAFVKSRLEEAGLDNERRALLALGGRPRHSFSTPVPLAYGERGGWHWLALSPLPPRPLGPAKRPPLHDIVADIQTGLEGVLDPDGAPAGWHPMHGDLTPWNLRRCRRGCACLIDWEDVAWGPPGADWVYYTATVAAMTGKSPELENDEAVEFWQRSVGARAVAGSDPVFNQNLSRVLASMRR